MPKRSLPKPRIFISHSAHEPEADKTLQQLVKCLKRDFDVLVDKQRLVAGQDFRAEIFSWINRAHGAVILFSSSALASQWVRTEAGILAWRHTLGKGKLFPLVPVLLSPVKRTDLEVKEFSPMRLTALQLVRSDDASNICKEVRNGLASLLQTPPADTPQEKLARKVAHLLKPIESAELFEAARAMGIDLSDWNDENEYAIRLAREMLDQGLPSAMKAVRELAYVLGNNTGTLVELVAPVWVSISAASTIPEIATRTDKLSRRLWVNGGDEDPRFTADHFVRRACCRAPDESWPVLLVPPDSGEDEVGHYKRVIKELLKTRLLRVESANDKLVNNVLAKRDREDEPVFVAFPPPGPAKEVIAALRTEFSTVTFFILTGNQLGEAPGSLVDVQFLEPKLQVDEEFEAYSEYITARTYHQKSGV